MKKKLFLCVALTALIATFFGCSNMLNTTVSNDSTVNGMPIQISLSKEAGRYVKAVENWSIDDVYAWKVKFTEETTGKTEVGYWDNGYTITHDEKETITVEYNTETKTFGMSKVATGTYTLEIMSTSTSNTFTVYGKTTGFVIDSEKINSKTMFVDLKRETTGSLLLSFSLSKSLASTDINGKLKAVLTPLTGDGDTKEYTASTETTADFSIAVSSEDSSTVTDLGLAVSSLDSGFYKLSFTDLNTNTKYKYWVSSDCQVIEIADDTSTTATVSLNRSTEKNYFATNDSANVGYNGLSASSPDEINNLLTSFTTELPKNSYINVYMDSSVPVIEASTIKALQNSLGNSTDYQIAITVYQAQSSSIVPSLIIETAISNSTTTVNTYIHGDIAIKATDDVTAVTVTKIGDITSIDDFTNINAKLVDGATITTTEITNMDDYKLYLSAETSAGEDNLSAYTASPMLTISNDANSTASSLVEIKSESYKARFDTSTTDAGTVTSVYAQLVGSGTSNITEFASSASIAATATASDATTTNYKTGAVIPYSSDAVTFSLSGVDSEISAYSWLLNSNTAGSESTMSLTPTTSKYVVPDETNTVSLNVQINGTWYYSEFTFTFSSTDYSHAVYITTDSYNNPNGIYEADYANASSGTAFSSIRVDSSSHTAFTFDDSQNLWITSYNDCLNLIKQSKLVSDSTFANGSSTEYNLTDIAFTNLSNIDVTYDTVDNVIYVLAVESSSNDSGTTTYTSKIYAFDPTTLTASTTNTDSNVTIDTSTWTEVLTAAGITSVDFTKIAVNDTTAYLADAAYNVFKITNFKDTTSSPSYVGNLATKLNITEGTDYLTLTDMQIGDGFGNDTNNLYVLMRQHTTTYNAIQYDSGSTYYSRGALCKIDSSNENAITSYGFSITSTEDTINTTKTQTFYTPSESSKTEFYGPRYFAAICPKKLVIADDGFYYTNTGDHGTVTNKDGFLEFDIDATDNQLSRTSANVTISTPNVTSYDKGNFN